MGQKSQERQVRTAIIPNLLVAGVLACAGSVPAGGVHIECLNTFSVCWLEIEGVQSAMIIVFY